MSGAEDKVRHAYEDVEGKVKEAAGKLTGDDDREAEGKAEQAKSDLKDAGENVRDAFHH